MRTRSCPSLRLLFLLAIPLGVLRGADAPISPLVETAPPLPEQSEVKARPEFAAGTAARIPAWAQTGKFRYARWDGGILDVVKGFLTDWPHWREPDQILATADWYEPRNVELVEAAGVNWIWVTFSNGFSLDSERPHQERLRAFIAACHDHGIHTSAYMSLTNIFPDDMFLREPRSRNWLALDKAGNLIPYAGKKTYANFAHVNRYLACLTHPQWRAYLRERVDRAIAAGCEAVFWDNAIPGCQCPRCQADYSAWRERTGAPDVPEAWGAYRRAMLSDLLRELQAHAREKRPDFLMYANLHRGLYAVNQTLSAIGTEDGSEPGLDSEQRVVSNVGILRYLWGESDGWRPVRVEYQFRLHSGPFEDRMTVPMAPRSHQLSVAEAAAHHVGVELYSLGSFQRDLYFRKPEAMANLKAAGAYNRFLEQHEAEYVNPRTLARIAFLANDDDRQLDDCKELAKRNVIFDVLFTSRLTENLLRSYDVLIAPDLTSLNAEAVALLSRRVEQGARLVISGGFGERDENLRVRDRSVLRDWFGLADSKRPAATVNAPKGRGVLSYQGEKMDWDKFVPLLAGWSPALVQVNGAPAVRFNVYSQVGNNRWILHLLNYGPEPAKDVRVSLSTSPSKVRIISPDAGQGGEMKITRQRDRTEFVVSSLDIYSVAIIEFPDSTATR